MSTLLPHGGSATITVVVTDGWCVGSTHSCISAATAVPTSPYRSIALQRSLNTSRHIVQQQRAATLQRGESVRVAIASDTKAEDYDSLGKLHALYCTITGFSQLSGLFGFLPKWATLSDDGNADVDDSSALVTSSLRYCRRGCYP